MNEPMNFLFLMTDQHSPFFTGYGGNPIVATPNIDAIAGRGVSFENAYCQNPLCVPSRSSMITGRYSKNIGIYDNMHILESNITTLPGVLSRHGYRTCLIGKAHFNGEQFHGYDQRPYGDLYGQGHQPDPARLPEFGESGLGDVLEDSGPSAIPTALTQTEICVAETCKWLQTHVSNHSNQPFFLSVHFDKPHFPLKAPERFFSRYRGKVSLPAVSKDFLNQAVPFVREAIAHNETGHHYGRDFEVQTRALEAYYACVEWVDDAIGRILAALNYLGLASSTAVIYTSDHGEMAGSHGTWQKSLFFESSVRVPLVMQLPEHEERGRVCDDIVGLVDLFPTICDLAGADLPAECDGISIRPLLEGTGVLTRRQIFSESAVLRATEYAGCMLRRENWKYCYYYDGSEELYDLASDPNEIKNLALEGSQQTVVAELREAVQKFWSYEEYLELRSRTPIMSREKHFYEFSNQFVLGDGTVADARP